MTDYKPLVSIIIPVYNGENYMRIAIDSALAQTYENIEIIVVNDGSLDDGKTERIALSYGNRIRYFAKENGGCASALNFGISKMRGEWFSWLSHDDVYEPDKVEREISCIKTNQLINWQNTIISCEAKIIDENGNEINHPTANDSGLYDSIAFLERLLFKSSLNGCGLLIPKDLINKVGDFSTELKFILDWEYWLRAALSGANLYRIGNERLVMNRVHRAQVTVRESNRYAEEMTKVSESLFDKVISSQNMEVVKDFYIYSGVNSQNELHKKYKCVLKDRHAFQIKLALQTFILKRKKQLRGLAARLYWKIVRNRKSDKTI